VLHRDLESRRVSLPVLVIRTTLTCTRSETNLKIKQAAHQTAHLTAPALVNGLQGSLRSEQPNNSLYTYEGTLDLRTATGAPRQVPLGPDQLLLRGAQIRNTPWLYGLVVFTGHQTKLMRNATCVQVAPALLRPS
jgi:phospholipid-transporting ATPase